MNALFDALIRASVTHRYLVTCAAGALILVGVWSIRNSRLDALPDFTSPTVVVQSEAPGLGSSDVEALVTAPLEQQLLGVPELANLRSTSSPGLSVIQMTFQDDADLFRARQLVGERIARAAERLPAGLPLPQLAPITAPVGALLKLAYTVPPGDEEALGELWQFAEWTLRPRLESIEGVSRLSVHGGRPTQIEVRLDASAMLGRGVQLADIKQTLETAQNLAALGHTTAGSQREPIRANRLWELGRLEPIESAVVTRRDGLPVRIEDVAEVIVGEAPAVGTARYDDRPAIYLQIDKLPWADTPGVTARVEETLSQLDPLLPAGAERQSPVFRQVDFIRTSLLTVGRAMALGAVFVILILVAFLRSPRLSLVSLTALPLSILLAVAVLVICGVTINGMILGGLAIAVGEVVDDAIVDVENIWRRLRENTQSGMPQPVLEVIQDASREVRGSVVYATFIVVIVLLPILLLGGLTGRIFAPLAEAYALAVVASLFVALTVTPSLSAIFFSRRVPSSHSTPRITQWLYGSYDRVLAGVERSPGRIVLAATVSSAAALAMTPLLGGGFLPEFREGVLIAEVATWPGTSLEETTRLAARISSELRTKGGIPHVAARIGRASLDEDAAPAYRMELDLVLPSDAEEPEELAGGLIEVMRAIPGLRISVEGFLGERINELLSGERAPIAVKLYGSDLPSLRSSASRLVRRIAQIEGVEAVRSPETVDVPTLELQVDETRLATAAVQRGQVFEAVAAWSQGLPVAEIRTPGGFFVPIVITGESRFRERERLDSIPVSIGPSAALPLAALASVKESSEPAEIRREGGRRIATVTARAEEAELSTVAGRIEAAAKEEIEPGTDWRITGQAAERHTATVRLVTIALLVLTAVFAFLWLAFGSVVDAGVVLGGLPLGMIGGVLAVLLLPEGLSMAGFVGFVALSGIISRNGIMLVAHKNQLLAAPSTASTEACVLQAARERLLPIVMTAATTFFGLLPLAASLDTAGSELEAPMAVIVCAGLLSSTTLNLVAVPAFFVWRERRSKQRKASHEAS